MSLTLHFLFVILLLLLLSFQYFHFAIPSPNPTGLSLRVDPDDSPQSPLYGIENLTAVERIEKLVTITNARVNYLDSILRPNANLAPENIQIPISRDGFFYVVAFQIGTQRHLVKLYLDTGGGLIWTQCQPCRNCFPQRLPIYDHRISSSYSTLPCSHPLCNGDNRLYDCINGVCMYHVRYGGGATTSGVASLESFQFMIHNDGVRSFNNVIFGCSSDSNGFKFANGDISGIFGLNTSPDSMASQFSPLIHSRFSYCLVPFPHYMPRPIVLRFGEDIPQPPHLQTTMFVPPIQQQRFYYYLELLDISVANHRIGFHPDIFSFRPDGTGGLFIDSGVQFTKIDTNTVGINAYETVMVVFRAYYGSRRLVPMAGPVGFELCYRTPPNYHDFAAITFHFNGADYTVGGEYGHIFLPLGFCVAIGKGNGVSVLGAWHQQNKRIVYDRIMGALQFADEQCVNDVL